MFDLWPDEIKERIEKEGSLKKLVSVFVSMAIEELDEENARQLPISNKRRSAGLFETAKTPTRL